MVTLRLSWYPVIPGLLQLYQVRRPVSSVASGVYCPFFSNFYKTKRAGFINQFFTLSHQCCSSDIAGKRSPCLSVCHSSVTCRKRLNAGYRAFEEFPLILGTLFKEALIWSNGQEKHSVWPWLWVDAPWKASFQLLGGVYWEMGRRRPGSSPALPPHFSHVCEMLRLDGL